MLTVKLDRQNYSQPLSLGHTVLVRHFGEATKNTDATEYSLQDQASSSLVQ